MRKNSATKRPKPPAKPVRLTACLPAELVRTVKVRAAEQGCTVSALVQQALESVPFARTAGAR
jgi:hypothetical protein